MATTWPKSTQPNKMSTTTNNQQDMIMEIIIPRDYLRTHTTN